MTMEFTLPFGTVVYLRNGDMVTFHWRDHWIKFSRPGIGMFFPSPAFRLLPGDDPVAFLEKKFPQFRVTGGSQGGVKHYFLELRNDEPTIRRWRKSKEE